MSQDWGPCESQIICVYKTQHHYRPRSEESTSLSVTWPHWSNRLLCEEFRLEPTFVTKAGTHLTTLSEIVNSKMFVWICVWETLEEKWRLFSALRTQLDFVIAPNRTWWGSNSRAPVCGQALPSFFSSVYLRWQQSKYGKCFCWKNKKKQTKKAECASNPNDF